MASRTENRGRASYTFDDLDAIAAAAGFRAEDAEAAGETLAGAVLAGGGAAYGVIRGYLSGRGLTAAKLSGSAGVKARTLSGWIRKPEEHLADPARAGLLCVALAREANVGHEAKDGDLAWSDPAKLARALADNIMNGAANIARAGGGAQPDRGALIESITQCCEGMRADRLEALERLARTLAE